MAAYQAPPSLGLSRQEHCSGLPFPSPTRESEKWKWSLSVVSDSWRPHKLQPIRLLHPWDFLGKSTRVACHCLLCFSSSMSFWLFLRIFFSLLPLPTCCCLLFTFSIEALSPNHNYIKYSDTSNTCVVSESNSHICSVSSDKSRNCLFLISCNYLLKTRHILWRKKNWSKRA